MPITRSDLLGVIVRELIDEVIEEKITGEIMFEIIAQNQLSKIADRNLILHRDAMAVAEQIFKKTVVDMLINEVAVPMVRIEDAKVKFRVQLQEQSNQAKAASAREKYSVFSSDSSSVMQELFSMEKFNCFRDLTESVVKEAMSEAIIMQYIVKLQRLIGISKNQNF